MSDKKLNGILQKTIDAAFVQAVTDLRNLDETEIFLKDFFTQTEFETFSKRLAVAYYLKKGRSYANIQNNLKVSSATIASVQEMINKAGFKLIIKKVEAEEWANQWSEKIKGVVKKNK